MTYAPSTAAGMASHTMRVSRCRHPVRGRPKSASRPSAPIRNSPETRNRQAPPASAAAMAQRFCRAYQNAQKAKAQKAASV